MGIKDASERVGVTLRMLYRFIDTGQIPAIEAGRVMRLRTVDVEAFLDPQAGDDPDQGSGGVRVPRRPFPSRPGGPEHLALPPL
jgi:excisionase family DNA binding protein